MRGLVNKLVSRSLSVSGKWQNQQLRRLNIHEYQGAELMGKYGVNVPKGVAVSSLDEVKNAIQQVFPNETELVVKSQILAGGRGLGTFKSGLKGGVHIVNRDQVPDIAGKMLGQVLVTKQTGPQGKVVSKVYLCEKLSLVNEMYFSIILDRKSAGPLIIACKKGGTSIEDLAEKFPDMIIKVPIDVFAGITDEDAAKVVDGLAPKAADRKDSIEQVKKLYELFRKTDCTMLEINPLAFFWGFMMMNVGLRKNPTSEIKIGIVLDLQTPFSQICLTSINMSLSDFYENHSNYTTRLAIHIRDSLEDPVQASAAALDLIKNEKVSAIIGPRSSLQAEFMIRLANKSQVPVITFSATSPLLTSTKTPYFVRATLNDLSQVRAIAAIVKSFEWRSVVAIYVDNEFGEGIMPYLADALQDVHTCITIRSVISLEASNDQITNQLYKLMTMQTRVFVAHMPPNLGFRVIQKARDIGMMGEGYVWIFTDGMTNWISSTEHGSSLENMQGVLGLRSRIPNSKELGNFSLRWETIFGQANAKPNVFALRAYDSITALAMAVEKADTKNLRYDKLISAFLNNTTDLGTLGVSRYGPSLLKALSDVDFNGLAGKFKLVNMELESSTFDIINFIGKEERIIGSWTPTNGLVNENPTSERLGPVIWPGKSTVIPRGWEIPTDGKKTFKVGVPLKRGFLGFVDVKQADPRKATIPTGYSIEVFEAALKRLPYSVIHRYVTFDTPNHSYDTLVEQVHNGMFDAAVGDITIRENRFLSVDFTLPYTESGVFMLVPMKDNENNTWFFLQPWSLDLWVTTACFFIFIGFIVWILEHRVNTDFRGPPHHQIGTSFWFSFSTINFAHREKVVSNLARFVVIVWCFVVLVLTQSYTANLTSFLTVQRLKPEVTTVNELIKNEEIVGYQNGSFVLKFLIKKGFQVSKLKAYNSAEECHTLLITGTSKGGIAAAFDEVAYLKVIISQYCNKYAIVEPSFKSSGFGFVFPKNSPLTDDVSRAILEVIENDEMQQIENKWFSKKSNCSDPTLIPSHNRLSVSSFWGLFLIVGVTSLLALLVFVAFFFYEHRHTFYEDSEISFWRKLTILVRSFDEKDIKSHMFKDSAVHNVSLPSTQCTPRSSTVQNIPWPQNPSENMEFELRRVSLVPSEGFFTPQLEQDEDEEANTLREVE